MTTAAFTPSAAGAVERLFGPVRVVAEGQAPLAPTVTWRLIGAFASVRARSRRSRR